MAGSIFKWLASVLRKHSVRPLLVGGYAVIAHKIQRMTFDIDLMVTADDCARLEPEIIAEGYSVFNRSNAFVQFKSEKPGLRDLDFLIGDKRTVEGLVAQGQEISIAEEKFIVPSPGHCIAMKLHSMEGNKKREIKDFPDVVQLMVHCNIDPAGEAIKNLFVKYHAMELYEKTVEAVKAQLAGNRS